MITHLAKRRSADCCVKIAGADQQMSCYGYDSSSSAAVAPSSSWLARYRVKSVAFSRRNMCSGGPHGRGLGRRDYESDSVERKLTDRPAALGEP